MRRSASLVPAPECSDVIPGSDPPTPVAFGTTGVTPLGGTLTVTPTTKGTHHYICLIHPWMLTDVTVK